MAAEAQAKPKKKKKSAPAGSAAPAAKPKAGDAGEEGVLASTSAPRSERTFEPKTTPAAILSWVAASLAVVALGAGGMAAFFLHDGAPSRYAPQAPYILGAGAGVLIAVILFGRATPRPVRVGDAGIAVEKGFGELERIAWHAVTRVALGSDTLAFESATATIAIPLAVQPDAAARALREARRRIPAKVADIEGKLAGDDAAGAKTELEPPQVAGKRCSKSDKPIAFEKDARLCGRCGALYHKDGVPWRCVACDAKLK